MPPLRPSVIRVLLIAAATARSVPKIGTEILTVATDEGSEIEVGEKHWFYFIWGF